MGSIFFPACVFSVPTAPPPPTRILCAMIIAKKKFSRLFLQDSAPHCPGKKIQVCHAVQYTFPKAISFEVQDHTSTPISVKFWDTSSCDTRFRTIINSMTEKSLMLCCLFSFSSRIYTERNIFPQVFSSYKHTQRGKNTCGNVIELSFRGGKDPLLFFKQSDK